MPVLISSSYVTAEDVLNRLRVILNDSEVVGGDVLTDTAPYTFELLNAGYERVQTKLSTFGMEVSVTEWWLIGLPIIATIDPEARMIVDDSGCNIIYPNGIGNVFSNAPQLPPNLVLPKTLWERQSGTTQSLGRPMKQPNSGLPSYSQGNALCDWEWMDDGLRFRGATQSQDVKIKGEKTLPRLIVPTDPVPIRGVTNAAAYQAAKIFADSRGASIAAEAKDVAEDEIFSFCQDSARRRSHKQVRRHPFSGGRRGRR